MRTADLLSPIKRGVFRDAKPSIVDALVFDSVASMELRLDGSEQRFADYFFAIYHCLPDEHDGSGNDINTRRERLRNQFPEKVTPVGKRFVLQGQPAWLALAAYYQAMNACETLDDELRSYAKERLEAITEIHQTSQSLPVPIDLTEGQLADDKRLDFLTLLALDNGQVFLKGSRKAPARMERSHGRLDKVDVGIVVAAVWAAAYLVALMYTHDWARSLGSSVLFALLGLAAVGTINKRRHKKVKLGVTDTENGSDI